jgi:GT2 family glycosyltransferase
MLSISIIIVSWNARHHLWNCLESIRETGGSLVRQVIVVDNASTDGSPEMVSELFPEVTLIRLSENLGFARANNLGLKRASGNYLALVNSDVIVHKECFARLVEFLENHHEVGLVGPKILGADGQLQRTCRQLPTLWNTLCRTLVLDSLFPNHPWFSGREMRHWNHENQADVEVLSGCFWLARREAVEKVGGLDERFFFYAEDVDWCKRFHDTNWKVVFVPQATATHFGGGSSSNAPLRYSIEMLRANLIYWNKHHGVLGKCGYYLLSIVYHGFRLVPRAILRMGRSTVRGGESKFMEHFVCLRWLLTGKWV